MKNRAQEPAHNYHGYTQWKGWRGEFATTDREARYYAAELGDVELGGKRVLEVGFGNGSFLAWAREQGAQVTGTEVIDALIDQARAKGYDAQPASLQALSAARREFDLVVAFDVFEHWNRDELVANMQYIHTLLAPGGMLLARFPNGHSPFGRVFQHGDLTHVTTLSSSRMAQLAQMTGFAVARIDNARRVAARRDLVRVEASLAPLRRARIEMRSANSGFGACRSIGT